MADFTVSHLTNPVIRTLEGRKQLIETSFGSREGGWVTTLLDTDKPVIIDYLEFAANSATLARLRIYITKDGVQVPLRPINSIGSDRINLTMQELTTNNTGYFQILEYNDSSNIYKVALRLPLYLLEGGKIEITNTGSSNVYLGALVTGRWLT